MSKVEKTTICAALAALSILSAADGAFALPITAANRPRFARLESVAGRVTVCYKRRTKKPLVGFVRRGDFTPAAARMAELRSGMRRLEKALGRVSTMRAEILEGRITRLRSEAHAIRAAARKCRRNQEPGGPGTGNNPGTGSNPGTGTNPSEPTPVAPAQPTVSNPVPGSTPAAPPRVGSTPAAPTGTPVPPARTPVSPTSTPTPKPTTSGTTPPPIPQLATWQNQMLTYGRQVCNALGGGASADQKLADTYYDSQWVFYQIADYTKDASWNNCAQTAERTYRDNYVVPANGNIPGYWIFSHGLTQDYLRTGDTASRNAAISLAKNAAFARDSTQVSETVSSRISRETAYVIMTYLNAEDLGEARRSRLALVVNHALGHLNEWFVARNADFVKPFMVGLTSHALISFYERTGDSRIIPALTTALDRMWETLWVPSARAFLYIDRNFAGEGAPEPAPDLNLLIAPRLRVAVSSDRRRPLPRPC